MMMGVDDGESDGWMRRDFRLVAGASLWEDKSVAVIPDRGENDAPLLSGGREALDGSSVGKAASTIRARPFLWRRGAGESRRGGEKGELTLLLWLFLRRYSETDFGGVRRTKRGWIPSGSGRS